MRHEKPQNIFRETQDIAEMLVYKLTSGTSITLINGYVCSFYLLNF